MKRTELMNKATRAFNKAGFKIKKHSPEILVVAGVVGVIASAVMACKATTKLSDITEDAKNDIQAIKDYADSDWVNVKKEDGTIENEYTEKQKNKDLTITYTQTGIKLAKLYAPSVGLGVLSLTAILAGHNITRKRNVAISAAYMAVDKSFKEYRGRVVERFGKELDRELKYNIQAREIEETIVDSKGKEKTVKKTVQVVDPSTIDDFSRIYYEGNIGYDDEDPQATLMFLKRQQAYATDKLKAQGYLFLNDVYEMLGFAKTKTGFMIGWLYDEEHPIGDNFVDFGIYDLTNENKIRFIDGYEKAILLEFNHDGNILDLM